MRLVNRPQLSRQGQGYTRVNPTVDRGTEGLILADNERTAFALHYMIYKRGGYLGLLMLE